MSSDYASYGAQALMNLWESQGEGILSRFPMLSEYGGEDTQRATLLGLLNESRHREVMSEVLNHWQMTNPYAHEQWMFGVSGSLGAGGFTAEGEGSIGFYADRNGNIGGVTSAEGGWGFKSPGLTASISLDFYNYGENLDIDHLAGPNITTSLQLGIIGFSYTHSTDKKLRPNNQLNIFSISFGLRGLSFTQKMGASGYLGTKKNDKNEKEEQ